MNADTREFISWVGSNNGLEHIVETMTKGWEAKNGNITPETALSVVHTIKVLIGRGGINSFADEMRQAVNFGNVEADDLAIYLQRFSDMQGVS